MNEHPDLQNRLMAYAASGVLPMHMPGHKRNLTAAPWLSTLGGGIDVTEVEGFDDLHHACGVLRDEMERAAALWGAKRTFFLVNGSSCGLLAAVYALGAGGGEAVVARNCHKSIYHGLELCGLHVRWLRPDWCGELGLWGSVSPDAVAQALRETPKARFVLLTSPTYEGVMSDLAAIAALCHDRGVPLIVDEAHGAHLGFGGFPSGGVAQGADLVIQSAHKTLPSLTQTALLHLQGELADENAVERALNIFESSSPSYVLMSSLSGCVRFLEHPGALSPWREGLSAFGREISGLKHLSVPNYGAWAGKAFSGVFQWDPSKLLLLTPDGGFRLKHAMLRRFGVALEMAQPHYAIALTGAGDDADSLTRLARALAAFDGELTPGTLHVVSPPPEFPRRVISAGQALSAPWEEVPLSQAAGRIAAQYLWVYPPGVPLTVPGEEVTPALLEWLSAVARGGAELRRSPPCGRDGLRVIRA